MQTLCGHDSTVRCVKCTGREWDPVQPRRWVKFSKRVKAFVREKISPEEARTAVAAILVGNGLRLEQVREYDERKDEFVLLVRLADGKMDDAYMTGEAVAQTVIAARAMAGMRGGLKRPSERTRRGL